MRASLAASQVGSRLNLLLATDQKTELLRNLEAARNSLGESRHQLEATRVPLRGLSRVMGWRRGHEASPPGQRGVDAEASRSRLFRRPSRSALRGLTRVLRSFWRKSARSHRGSTMGVLAPSLPALGRRVLEFRALRVWRRIDAEVRGGLKAGPVGRSYQSSARGTVGMWRFRRVGLSARGS